MLKKGSITIFPELFFLITGPFWAKKYFKICLFDQMLIFCLKISKQSLPWKIKF